MSEEPRSNRRYGEQAERAYEKIRMAIIKQEILPGTAITAELYAGKLGMSRTPVREAIVRLAHEDLLTIVPRRGAFVRVFTLDEIRHNYEIAEALEGMIVYLATPRITAQALSDLEGFMEGMEEALENKDIERWVGLDERFHNELNSFCDNERLVRDRAAIQSQILRSRLLRVPSWIDKSESNRDHRKIWQAIRAGNARAARDAMHSHWERIREEFVRVSGDVGAAASESQQRNHR